MLSPKATHPSSLFPPPAPQNKHTHTHAQTRTKALSYATFLKDLIQASKEDRQQLLPPHACLLSAHDRLESFSSSFWLVSPCHHLNVLLSSPLSPLLSPLLSSLPSPLSSLCRERARAGASRCPEVHPVLLAATLSLVRLKTRTLFFEFRLNYVNWNPGGEITPRKNLVRFFQRTYLEVTLHRAILPPPRSGRFPKSKMPAWSHYNTEFYLHPLPSGHFCFSKCPHLIVFDGYHGKNK